LHLGHSTSEPWPTQSLALDLVRALFALPNSRPVSESTILHAPKDVETWLVPSLTSLKQLRQSPKSIQLRDSASLRQQFSHKSIPRIVLLRIAHWDASYNLTFTGTVLHALSSNSSRHDLLVVTQSIEFEEYCSNCCRQTFHRDRLERAAGPGSPLKLRSYCQKCGQITSEIDFG